MPHTSHILVAALGFAFAVIGCDNAPPREVPSGAARGLGPAPVEPPRVSPAPRSPAVAAWVNGEAITEAVVDAQLERARANGSTIVPRARRRQVLERLIDEQLIKQWVERAAVEVAPGEVDAAIAASIEGAFGSEEALRRHLEAQGQSLEAHRDATRLRLAEEKILAAGGAPLTDEALERLYREVANRPPTKTLYQLEAMRLPAATRGEAANKLAAQVRTEADFHALPGRRAELGWVERAALAGPLAQWLADAKAPGVGGPIDTPSGPEIYWLRARADRPTEHFVQVRERLEARAQAIARADARARLVRNLRLSAKIEVEDAELSERMAPDDQMRRASPGADSGLDPGR